MISHMTSAKRTNSHNIASMGGHEKHSNTSALTINPKVVELQIRTNLHDCNVNHNFIIYLNSSRSLEEDKSA
jgi:hypothetical protein